MHCLLILDRGERAARVARSAPKGWRAEVTDSTAHALGIVAAGVPVAAVMSLGTSDANTCWPLLAELGRRRRCFSIVLSRTAVVDVRLRLECFAAGARMVTGSEDAVREALLQVMTQITSGGRFSCPHCGMPGLTAEALSTHVSLWHAAERNVVAPCPVCGSGDRTPLPVHLNHAHGPVELREPAFPRFAAFAWVVCRAPTGQFLLVNEPAGLCASGTPGYWLPAGRLDAGESFVAAAERECREEAGIAVIVTGVLRLTVTRGTPRMVLLAQPRDEASLELKSVPDFESVGACWVDVQSLAALRDTDYRSPDPASLFPRVASGELVPRSVNTEAFQAVEALVERVTAGHAGAAESLQAALAALQCELQSAV